MIQNYSNLLNDETRNLYKKNSDKSAIVLVDTMSYQWLNDIRAYVDLDKKTALLRYSNNDAKEGASILSSIGTEFVYVPKTPISEITTDVSWLYNAIAQFFILKKYTEYDFMDEIPEESIGDRKVIKYIKNQLENIRKALKDKDDQNVIDITREMAKYFGYISSDEHVRNMISTIVNPEYHPAFRMDELTHVSITFHSSKGLEYEQIIVFANDYKLDRPDSIYNHYVAVTRAKNKLIIVRLKDKKAWEGECYYNNLNKLFNKSNVKLSDVMTIVQ
jgi:hypothetical protein